MSVNPQCTFKSEYSPEELSTLAVAYETICDAARIRHASSIVRDLVATSVFQVASTGEHDPLRIVDCVMYKLDLSMRLANHAKKLGREEMRPLPSNEFDHCGGFRAMTG